MQQYEKFLEFYSIKTRPESMDKAKKILDDISATKASGMLLNVLDPEKEISRVKRRKACRDALQWIEADKLQVRACIIERATTAMTQG